MRPPSDEPASGNQQNTSHRNPALPVAQIDLLEMFMKTRTPTWVTAAAVTAFFLHLVLFAAMLPRPAGATDLAPPPASHVAPARSSDPLVARGQYLARITGCHDCHTAGYGETNGNVPAERWLTGSDVGFKGPWGVSYPSNLRLTVQRMTEQQWLVVARAPRLPPMPWFNLRDMSDEDLGALYRFFRSLGPTGEQTPVPVAPGTPVKTPFIVMEPQNLPVTARR
jgi:mono/diheme cytochrome c family protein